jgi:hypothetical protein
MHRIPPIALLFVVAATSVSLAAAPERFASGAFPAGQRYLPPADHAPAHVSRAHVQTVALTGGRAEAEIHAGGGGRLLIWVLPVASGAALERGGALQSKPLSLTLRAPSGMVSGDALAPDAGVRRFELQGDLGLDLPQSQHALEVAQAEAGDYRLEISGSAEAVTIASAEPASPLTLATWVGPLSRQPGQPIVLHAELRDGRSAVAGARVSARLAGPALPAGAAIDLYDDGRHGDGAANDGVYARTLNDTPQLPGLWEARFEATGRDGLRNAFGRTSSGGFVAEPGGARLVAAATTARLVRQGTRRIVRVDASAEIEQAGTYRIEAVVAGPAAADRSRPSISWAEAGRRLEAGTHRVVLDIPLPAAANAKGVHVDVRLLALDPMGVAGRIALDVKP